ncbi:MAG: hypothetical protein FWE43_03750 [Streptococcaceae bacterium]|nr:hypothetical protein [Streptococcaceae bacterium]MCL2681580.1 hypothetical protein [Streptococcaceae bacterium]
MNKERKTNSHDAPKTRARKNKEVKKQSSVFWEDVKLFLSDYRYFFVILFVALVAIVIIFIIIFTHQPKNPSAFSNNKQSSSSQIASSNTSSSLPDTNSDSMQSSQESSTNSVSSGTDSSYNGPTSSSSVSNAELLGSTTPIPGGASLTLTTAKGQIIRYFATSQEAEQVGKALYDAGLVTNAVWNP